MTAGVSSNIAANALWLAAIIFILGLVGVIVRRNLIFVLLSIEVMLNAAALAFIAGGALWGQAEGQVVYLFVLSVAAAETAVALALILRIGRYNLDLRSDQIKELRG